MMKPRKLTKKLWSYFAISLLIFSLVIGTVFYFLFMGYNRTAHEAEMRRQAETLAAALPAFRGQGLMSTETEPPAETAAPNHRGPHHGMGMMRQKGSEHSMPSVGDWCRHSYGLQSADGSGGASQTAAFLQDLDRLVQGTVWIVDAESRTISSYGEESSITTTGLPMGMEAVLGEVLAGGTPVTDTRTALFAEPMVTAGAPIRGEDGSIKGAVLIHRHLSDLQAAESTGLKILGTALLLGLFLSALLAAALARRFISPLYRMKDTAESFRAGDYSARTQLQQDDELGLLGESLDELGSRLGAAERERAALQQQRQEFLAAVSHELRTPLTVIKGTWELLQSGFIKEENKLQDCRQRMGENLTMLERLVRDLLELTRLQNPGFKVQKEPLNLLEPFRDALRSAGTLAEKKGVQLEASLPEALPFLGDYGRLRQLLLIILDNAVKFSPTGAEIEVEATQQDSNWQLNVTDQGPGISPEDLPHIFDRFKKGGTKNAQGTGLGLAIAREIALRHDIELTCESQPGQGASFILKGRAEAPPAAN